MSEDLIYQIALTQIPQIGPVCARQLSDRFGEARAIFHTSAASLRKIEGLGETRIQAIRSFRNLQRAEQEIAFIENNNIQPLFIRHPDYPRRLLNCSDAPVLLYSRGTADLNYSKVIAIIGTRVNTEYGRQLTEQFVQDLAGEDVLIISGLAFGIDALAHKAALKNKLPTVAVLAHGLDIIYPTLHTVLAGEMIRSNGGLLTEFNSQTQPDRHHFPARNRIVAGMSDAVVVVETGEKGGSLITAELANGYHRDVFAFPGRVNDPRSSGCLDLIRNNRAVLIRKASDMLEFMGWTTTDRKIAPRQKEIFIDLNEHEKKLVSIIGDRQVISIDELNWQSGLSNSQVAAAVLSLELKNVVVSLPGKVYRLT